MKRIKRADCVKRISASLPGNGGRGLKLRYEVSLKARELASLPGNGGRGLKQECDLRQDVCCDCIAPRQRGAWIETSDRRE